MLNAGPASTRLSLQLYGNEKRQFLEIAERLQSTNREALVYLLRLDKDEQIKTGVKEASTKRYNDFFANIGWGDKRRPNQILLLLRLAESHPDLPGDRTELSRLSLEDTRNEVGEWRQKYLQFFEKHGWSSKSPKTQIAILLELAATHPVFFESTKRNRPKFDKRKFPIETVEEKIENFFDPQQPQQDANFPDNFPGQLNAAPEAEEGFKPLLAFVPETPKSVCRIELPLTPKKQFQDDATDNSLSLGIYDPIVTKMNSKFHIGMSQGVYTNPCQASPPKTKKPRVQAKQPKMDSDDSDASWTEEKMLKLTKQDSEFRMPAGLLQRCNNFFDFHQFETETDADKLEILLDLAESHQSLDHAQSNDCLEEKLSKRRKKCKPRENIDEESDGSWHDGSTPKKEKTEIVEKELNIKVPKVLSQRYKGFFETIQWGDKSRSDQMALLIRLAESHPDLDDNGDRIEFSISDFHEMKANAAVATPKGRKWWQGQNVNVALSPEWRQRYSKFFEKQGWKSKVFEDRMRILLALAQTHPLFFEGDNRTKERLRFKKSKFSDRIGKEEAKMNAELRPKDADDIPLPLLAPDYYMKFSEEARSKRPWCGVGQRRRRQLLARSSRTYAAMANTRRHIVEWRQLKQLMARCVCSRDQCHEMIDPKTIRVKQIGYVIKVTAHCCDSEKHLFTWTSSPRIYNETNSRASFYVLNVAVVAAVNISGNNSLKLQHFARTLKLSWATPGSQKLVVRGCLMPVVKKCFEMTQSEMLQKLKNEKNGDLVLAGDGQFDSPGACATLCTYTLMALGVEENQEDTKKLKRCGYVISQVVIDRRHADNKSMNMERIGLHWALQPVIKAGIKVAELVTDEHVQVVSDFKKIRAAAEERAANEDDDDDQDRELTVFKNSLSTALIHAQPPVDVEGNASELLSFYSAIVPSNDIWHKAKNLLKSVSAIAQSASFKEQQCYRRYAKMLRNYLWECAEGAQGNADVFVDLWTTVEHHLQGDHAGCSEVDLHSKTKLMEDLDRTTRSFTKLIACISRVTAAAQQLCRFRNTGILESYNGLTLKYCPKRIGFEYDLMTMRKQLAALDHNHHVLRPYQSGKHGRLLFQHRYRKSTKAYSLTFKKEEKTYEYIGHLMAAVLLHRCQSDFAFDGSLNKRSAVHPRRIQPTVATPEHEQSLKVTCEKWLSKKKASLLRVAAAKRKIIQTASGSKKREAVTASFSSSENETEVSDSDDSSSLTFSDDDIGDASEDEWVLETSASQKSTCKKKKSLVSLSSSEDEEEPAERYDGSAEAIETITTDPFLFDRGEMLTDYELMDEDDCF